MGFFSSIKNGVQRAALVSQCAIAGVNLKKAETGDAVEQFKYGSALLVGKTPLRQNKEEAVEWLRKSAEQGNDQAQKLFGECYYQGTAKNLLGFSTSSEGKAEDWFLKAQRSRDANIRATAVSRIEQIRAERQEREERELQKEIAKSQIRANEAMASQARSARDLNRSIENRMERDRHPHCW